MWRIHLFHLLARAWHNLMGATSTSTLGFFLWTVAVALVGWGAAIAAKWIKSRRQKIQRPVQEALLASLLPGVIPFIATATLLFFAWITSVVVTVYLDHEYLVNALQQDRQNERELKNALELRRHNLVVGDPVFDNFRAAMLAFVIFRREVGDTTACEIRITYPPQFSGYLPTSLSTLAWLATRCSVNSRSAYDPDPQLNQELTEGMRSDRIVVHMHKNQRGGMRLYDSIASLVPMEMSYVMPKGSAPNLIWFQFGEKVNWNNESK